MTHAFGSLDELGEGYGFRKVRRALGVDAFGVNAIVMPPRYEGVHHYHDEQDELYFVHSGTARVEVEGTNVRSHRVVAANPRAIAQGLADAWCRVIGRVPFEVVGVSMGDDGRISVLALDGEVERTGSAMVSLGWERALVLAVGRAMGVVDLAR